MAVKLLTSLACALAAVGLVLAGAGCSNVLPLGHEQTPVRLPPARPLGAPITMQVLRSQAPTPASRCPAGSIGLFGSDPYVPRASVSARRGAPVPAHASTAPPTPTAAPSPSAGLPAGVACFRPVGKPVTVTSAGVSSVTTFPQPEGPAFYGFVVAFPAAEVPALTALVTRAHDSGDAVGMSVAGQLWQAPQLRRSVIALRAEQINLLSRRQALRLHRLLAPAG